MHRIPLYLPERTISWDRETCELELFAKALNCGNVRETEEFLSILDDEAISFKKAQYSWAKDLFNETFQLLSVVPLMDCDITRVSENFTKIILRAPSDSAEFVNALRLRGQIFFEHLMIQRAFKDLELCVFSNKNHLSVFHLCEVNGYLTICSHLIGRSDKRKIYYKAYERLKGKLSANALQSNRLEKIMEDIDKLKDKFSQHDSTTIVLPKKDEYIKPFDGFNSDSEIPLSSSMCFLKNVENSSNPNEKGVYTSADIAKGNIVVVEHSLEIGVHTPLVQCELCFKRELFVYTCLKCRYKTYCSVECMNNDSEQHKFECIGYKNGALLILDVVQLFRFFQRTVSELSETIFHQRSFKNAPNAEYIWTNLPKAIVASMLYQRPPISLILNKPDYNKMNDRQYATLMVIALRLTVFICRNTCIFDNAFRDLKISTKQKMLLTGCLLMRLQCHMLLNTLDFEFNLLLEKDKDYSSNSSNSPSPPSSSFLSPLAAAFSAPHIEENDVDIEKELASAEKKVSSAELPPLKHTNECHSITRLLSTYIDKIVMVCILNSSKNFLLFAEAAIVPITERIALTINQTLAVMNSVERYEYMKKFAINFHENFVDYFLNVMSNNSCVPQVLSTFCMTLRKFRHSCDPNVEAMIMDNGFIIGKTLKDVKQGEELVVSYKANHMHHPRDERQKHLQRLNIECCCKLCQGALDAEFISRRSRINCHNCGQEITYKCDACNTYYTKELQRFRKEVFLIEKKIAVEKDSTKLDCLYERLYELGKKNFSPQHETRIDITLKYIRFLAKNDLHTQAFQMIFELQAEILKAYELKEIWFTFCDNMLTIIKVIMSSNIKKPTETQFLPLKDLKELLDLAQMINVGQREHVKFYEIYDYHCIKIVDDQILLTRWQNELLLASLRQTIESLQKFEINEANDTVPPLLDSD